MMPAIFSQIRHELEETYRFRYVVMAFVSTTLKQRYRRSVLGFGWSLLSPILNYGIMAMVFNYAARGGIREFAMYVFSGALIYNLISSGINRSPGIMLQNEPYIKKIYLPKLVFVMSAIITEFVNFLLGFGALFALGLIFQKIIFDPSQLILPFLIGLALLMLIGLSIIVSIASVFFRDLVHIVPVAMQIAFFMTPVLYEPAILPGPAQKVLAFNPLYYFVEAFRAPLYYRQLPAADHLGIVFGISAICCIGGLVVLKRLDNKIIFKL